MKVTASAKGRYLGVFTSPEALDGAVTFQSQSSVTPQIVHMAVDWSKAGAQGQELIGFTTEHPDMGTSVLGRAQDLARNGQVLALSWDPSAIEAGQRGYYDGTQTPAISVQRILDGELDGYIRSVAKEVADFAAPLMMTLFGEADAAALLAYGADGQTYRGGLSGSETAQYGDPALLDGPERVRDAFRHVIDLFRQEGADNVSWFQYLGSDLLTQPDSVHPRAFYAGDSYIDWVGQSLYVKTPADVPASLSAGYQAWGDVTDKPFIIPELGLLTKGAAQDYADLFAELASFDRVQAAVLSDFKEAESEWGVSLPGARSGDWNAIKNATSFQAPVEVFNTETRQAQTLEDWRAAYGYDKLSSYVTGTDADDYLSGSAQADVFVGLLGDDVFIIDQSTDRVIEAENGGHDTVLARADHRLASDVEDLLLDGTDPLSGTGNSGANTMIGNPGNNRLDGGAGNDLINGGLGADTMLGGAGDDMYFVENANDQIVEAANGGFDVVLSHVSLTLAAHVEYLGMEGSGNLRGIGNASDNTLIGNAGDNRLEGRDGDDILMSGAGNDVLQGGAGLDYLESGAGADSLNGGAGEDMLDAGAGQDELILESGADVAIGGADADRFVFKPSGALVTIQDYASAEDMLDLSQVGLASRAALSAAIVDIETGSILSAGAGSYLFFEGVDAQAVLASDILI